MSDLHLNCVRAKDGEASESDDAVFRFLAAAKDRHHTEKTVRRPECLGSSDATFRAQILAKRGQKVGSDQILAGLQMSLS
jgi:hypothetical protein